MNAYKGRTLFWAVMALSLVGCESSPQPSRAFATTRIIENSANDTVNKVSSAMLETVLVVRLDVASREVSLGNVEYARVPKSYISRGFDPSWIEVAALDAQGRTVGQAWVANASVNVQEGRGTVILDEWSVVVAVPLNGPATLQTRPAMPVRIAVSAPNNQFAATKYTFPIAGLSKNFCGQYPKENICQPSSGERNPHFKSRVIDDPTAVSNPPEQ